MKLKNLLQGRLGRARFFSYILITLSVFTLLIVAYRIIFGIPGDEILAFYIAYSFVIVVLIIRRLHDLNLSGWWALLPPVLLPISIGILSAFLFSLNSPFFGGSTIRLMLGSNAIALLLLFFWKGTSGSNRFDEGSSV